MESSQDALRMEYLERVAELIKSYYEELARREAVRKMEMIMRAKEKGSRYEGMIRVAEPTYGWEEVVEVLDSLLSTRVTMGEKVRRFEEEFADYVGVKEAIMVNSGSSANLLALSIFTSDEAKYCGPRLRRGDQVITPAVTWSTTVYPLIQMGLEPIFVDVELGTYSIATELVEEAITPKTKGVFVVHLLGCACDIHMIRRICQERDLLLLEDACEALGSLVNGRHVGSFGEAGTFSFYFSHHISTVEGGMLVTDSHEVAAFARGMRSFGWARRERGDINPTVEEAFRFEHLGYNFRPTELQAAFGLHQLRRLEPFVRHREENAHYWNRRFRDYEDVFILPRWREGSRHSWFAYPLTIRPEATFTRAELTRYLYERGVETRPIMAGNIVEQPVMKRQPHLVHSDLKNSKLIMRNGFFFGNHHGIGDYEREYIADLVEDFVKSKIKR